MVPVAASQEARLSSSLEVDGMAPFVLRIKHVNHSTKILLDGVGVRHLVLHHTPHAHNLVGVLHLCDLEEVGGIVGLFLDDAQCSL